MMTSLVLYMLFVFFVVYCLNSVYFCVTESRLSVVMGVLFSTLKNLFPVSYALGLLLTTLMSLLLVLNVMGNFPLFVSSSMYYFFTVCISLTFWLSLIVSVVNTQLKGFISHMLPYGSPSALMLFLPLIELFSHIIRPLTLMIRLSTNLSSGHIMMFMFSFFSVSSLFMSVLLTVVLLALLFLEIAISALQAYIFSSLSYMYVSETI